MLEKYLRTFQKLLGYFLFLLLLSLLYVVSWQVFSRYILNSPSTVSEELARFQLMWLGLFGAAYTLGEAKHLSIDFISLKASAQQKERLAEFSGFCCLLFSLLLTIGGFRIVENVSSLKQHTPALQIPMAWIYLAVPVSGIIMSVYSLKSFFERKRWKA